MKHQLFLRTVLLSGLLSLTTMPTAYAEDGVPTGTGAIRCNNNTNVTCTCGFDCDDAKKPDAIKRLEPNRTPAEATESTDDKPPKILQAQKMGAIFKQ